MDELQAVWAWLSINWTGWYNWIQLEDNWRWTIWSLLWFWVLIMLLRVSRVAKYKKQLQDVKADFELYRRQREADDDDRAAAADTSEIEPKELEVVVTLDLSEELEALVRAMLQTQESAVSPPKHESQGPQGYPAGPQGPFVYPMVPPQV